MTDSMAPNKKIINAMSIDVEDYFHVSALAETIRPEEWGAYESRVSHNTNVILDLLDGAGTKGTFFVLGWEAERRPELVMEIYNRGHEIASHGYSHQLVYEQSPEKFREETLKSKQILEDLIQEEVIGYRAASYSITEKSLWALDILADLGFKYDSSIFPVQHDRYGIPDAKPHPHKISLTEGKCIVEFPLTTSDIMGRKLPIAGGGYFRIFPYWIFKWQFGRAVRKRPGVFYLHPWELDPAQPKVRAGRLSTFRHYHNLGATEARLKDLLSSFSFSPMREVLKQAGFEI